MKVSIMSIWQKRRVCTVLIIVIILYLLFSEKDHRTCNMSPEMTQSLHYQAEAVSKVLQMLNLNYFLCYGSLWGALYIQNILPWDTNVDFCVRNEEIMKHDESHLLRLFGQHGMDIEYNNKDGIYEVYNRSSKLGHAHVIVFESDLRTGHMRRVGWKNRITPPDMCEALHCFPPNLVEPPLPRIKYGNLEVPAPHEEIELLKYLYPNDWWKELKARDC